MKIGFNISIGTLCLFLWFVPCLADCPLADLTGDCRVKLEDLAVFAGQWLSGDGIPDDMVAIPGGAFLMGDSFNEGDWDELPVHTVTLSPFHMSKYQITNGQYCTFLNITQPKVVGGTVYGRSDERNTYWYLNISAASSASQIDFTEGPFGRYRYFVRLKGRSDMSNDPVVEVSWYGAAAYCNWRSQQEGKQPCYNLLTWTCDFRKNGYRLPTEAEWEFAARGGLVGKRFPWGDTISHDQANYYSDNHYSYDKSPTSAFHPIWSHDGIKPYTSQVGSFAPNGYGLYDMEGNVSDYCNDWYSEDYYKVSPARNPTGPITGTDRIIRGGSWETSAIFCRVCHRFGNTGGIIPGGDPGNLGFRVVLGMN